MSYRRSAIKSIQSGSISLFAVTSNTYALPTAVDRNYAVVVLISQTSNSGAIGALVNACRVELTDNSTVTGFVNSVEASTKTVYFMVIEFFPFVLNQPVQHLSISGTDGTMQAITTVGAKAVLMPGGLTSNDSAGTAAGMMGGSVLTNTTTVTLRLSAFTAVVACAVVDFK